MIQSVVVKFRIRLGIRNSGFEKKIRNYSRIPNYSEMAIPRRNVFANMNKKTITTTHLNEMFTWTIARPTFVWFELE